jgi:dolichol-phosphate mannosyltransferase
VVPLKDNQLISVCIPVLNEGGNILPLYSRLNHIADELKSRYKFEFVFTDNHSEDDTWDKIIGLAADDPRIKAARFTKNIGFQESILANLGLSSGDAIIQIDADLQDPPEMIPNFLKEWEKGYKVVYGIRASRQENFILNYFRKLGYRIISRVSTHPIPVDVGDFRLIDKKIKNSLIQSKTPQPFIRGIIASFELPSIGISYAREKRTANQSKFPIIAIIRLGINAVTNHSALPLKLPTFTGIVIIGISVVTIMLKILLEVFDYSSRVSISSISLLITFGIGLNAIFLGVIGTYLSKIYSILKNEPKFIVEESINIGQGL